MPLLTVAELKAYLAEVHGDERVRTMSRPAENPCTWKFEDVEAVHWQGGLLLFPWTQDAAAAALIHDAEYELTVRRQQELSQLRHLAGKYGYTLLPAAGEAPTQLMVPTAAPLQRLG